MKNLLILCVFISFAANSETYICSNEKMDIRLFNHKDLLKSGKNLEPAIIVYDREKAMENSVSAENVTYQAAFSARYDGICQNGVYQYIQITIDDYDIKPGANSPATITLGGRYKSLSAPIECTRGDEDLPHPSKGI